MSAGQRRSKRSILESLLAEGMVLVALDARAEDVLVPTHLAGDVQLRLNLSRRFGLPLRLDGWGVNATLTFAGSPFACRLPWSAIFLLVSHVSGQPYLFPEDIPGELLARRVPSAQPGRRGAPPRLALVRGDQHREEGAGVPGAAPCCQRTVRAVGPRHLRLVK